MISIPKTGRRLIAALVVAAFSAGAMAANGSLSFTAHSLNLNAGDSALLLALDGQGNAYQLGTVTDSSGRPWIRATKTNAQGAVVAAFQFVGPGDTPTAIKVDAQGEVVIAGSTTSADFPVTTSLVPGIQPPAAFVMKLDSGLTRLIASTLIGGTQYPPSCATCGTGAGALDVDSAGNVYLAGGTEALDFPVTAGAYQTAPPGYDSFGSATFGFVAELSPGLDKIVFATYFGSNAVGCMGSECVGAWGHTGFTAVAVNTSGAIIASADVALSRAPDGPQGGGTIVKFAPGGGSVLWSSSINPQSVGLQSIAAQALCGSGDVVVTGSASNGAAATVGALQSCGNVLFGGFVAKLSGSTGAIQFLTDFGCVNQTGTALTSINSVDIDASGTIWVTGDAALSDLPGESNLPAVAVSYLAALAPDGSSVQSLYAAAAGVFGGALSLASSGAPVALGSAGLLMLSEFSSGPSLLGAANSAASTATGSIAPAELISLYGTGLGPTTPLDAQVVDGVVESTLGGYQLLIGGVAAPLLYIGANQINAVVPNEVSGQDSASVTLVTPAGTFPLANLFIRPSEPEIFHDPVSGFAAATNQDGTLNSATNPAHAGEIVSVWGTGAGAPGGSPFPADGTVVGAAAYQLHYPLLPVSILAGSDSLEVDYAGDSPGEVYGLLQVNFRLPQSFPYCTVEAGSLSVSLQVGGAVSEPVSLHVTP